MGVNMLICFELFYVFALLFLVQLLLAFTKRQL